MVAFAEAVVAGPCPEILVEMLVSEPHLVTQKSASGRHAPPGLSAALPIVHVVLLEGARGAKHPHAGQPNRFFDFCRGRLVGIDPGPDLGLVRSARVPDAER